MGNPNDELIQRAIAAAEAGNKTEAKNLLANALQNDNQDAHIWYLLGQVIEKQEQKINCLEKAHELQPDNLKIKERLDQLRNMTVLPDLNLANKATNVTITKVKSNLNIWLIVAFTSALILVCIIANIPKSKSETITPEYDIANLDYFDIRKNQKNLTGVQWEEYDKTILGKRVQWQGFVDEIKSDITGTNLVWIDMDNPPDGIQDIYFEYPENKSLKYSRGNWIVFQGEYDGGIEIIFFLVELKNANILP